LIIDDVYPFDLQRTSDSATSPSSATFPSMFLITTTSPQQQLSTNTRSKPTASDAFNAACSEQDITLV
jgi:hypothetical protein